MKTLTGWIVGVFALGLVVGGLYRGISAEEGDTSAIANLPSVDCGSGREALYEPVTEGATTTLRVRCVAVETEPAPRRTAAAPSPYVAAPAPVPVAASPAPTRRETAPVADPNAGTESRSWEKSALIIGSAAGAGAGIGAIAKGGKGAAVGAAVGGVAGTVYDLATRNKKN